MSNGEETGLIYKKIPEIMAQMDAVTKASKNQQQGFAYRGIEAMYVELQKRLAKAGVFSAPRVIDMKREERVTKSGSALMYTVLTIEYTFYAVDGSSFTATTVGEAMDSGDKSCNKAMSVAHKYALIQVFCVPTSDAVDPDAESHEVMPGDTTGAKPDPAPGKRSGNAPSQELPTSPGKHVIPFGSAKNKLVEEVGIPALRSGIAWLRAQDKLSPAFQKTLDCMEAYIKAQDGDIPF